MGKEKQLLWGYIKTDGSWLAEPRFDDARPFHDGLARVKTGFLRGFIDKNGAFVVTPQFDLAGDFHEGLAWVAKDENYGFINTCGEVVIPLEFTKANDFHNGIARVHKGEKVMFITPAGETVGSRYFLSAGEFYDGLASALPDSGAMPQLFGYISQEIDWAIEPRFEFAGNFENGVAIVKENGLFGCIDTKGNWLIAPSHPSPLALKRTSEYQKYSPFDEFQVPVSEFVPEYHEGLAVAPADGKFGYINETGLFVIPASFAEAGPFCDGLARTRATSKGKWSYILPSGKPAFKTKFKEAEDFHDGTALVLMETDA